MGHEYTSKEVASLASKALRDPDSLTSEEIQALAASAMTQARDKDDAATDSPGQ